MERLQFTISINAPKQKVWDIMLNDATYREWTGVFYPGSYYDGDWSKPGSKMLFVAKNEDGTVSGMVSKVKEYTPYDRVSVEHYGEVVNGEEQTDKPWAGSLEQYTFTEENGVTTVLVDLDSNEEFKQMFEETWPKALAKIKEMAEK